MLGATLPLFIPSLQTPTSDSNENKTKGNLRVQITIGKETLAAPMYKENSNNLYPQVHIVNNPMPIVQIYLNYWETIVMFFIRWKLFLLVLVMVLTEKFPALQVSFSITVLMETLQKLLTTVMLRLLMETLHCPP